MRASLQTGFAVLYQWRLKPGMERQFRDAWEELTELLKRQRGARGSRLHSTDYGSVIAYAQWPDQASWEKSCELHAQDAALSQRLLEAVEETWPPVLMTTLSDLLLPESETAQTRHEHTH